MCVLICILLGTKSDLFILLQYIVIESLNNKTHAGVTNSLVLLLFCVMPLSVSAAMPKPNNTPT